MPAWRITSSTGTPSSRATSEASAADILRLPDSMSDTADASMPISLANPRWLISLSTKRAWNHCLLTD